IDDSEKDRDLGRRLATLISFSTRVIYGNICRGLFERHKLLFSALICFQILRHNGDIRREEWNLFLRGSGPVDRTTQSPNPAPSQLSQQQWDLLFASEERVTETPPLQGLCTSITEEWEEWTAWADNEEEGPGVAQLPGGFAERINSFQKLLLIKAFREDQLLQCVGKFVGEKLGSTFAER
ncbi:unnamed protein product, partial [Choristocarpus tenellus]